MSPFPGAKPGAAGARLRMGMMACVMAISPVTFVDIMV